jgi:ABC-type proline/glycine betaine transport system permease subunit
MEKSLKSFRAVLFDFDGTLVDSMPYWSQKMCNILDVCGIAVPSDLFTVITALGDAGTAKYFREKLGVPLSESEMIKMARTFGATKSQIFKKIIFPANLKTLFNSLKINIGLSLVGVIAGEFLVSKAGLGYLIVYGGQVFQLDLVMASVVILGVLATVMYGTVILLEKLILKTKKFG